MSLRMKLAMITALKVFNAVGIAVLIALVFVVLARIAASQKQASSDTSASTTRIENDLNCLGRFFNQKDRQNLVISDLNTCTITNTATGTSNVLSGPPSGTSNATPTSQSEAPVVTAPTTPQITNSAPKDTTSAPPDPEPNTVDKILAPVRNLLGGI